MNKSTKIATGIILTLGVVSIVPVLAGGAMHSMPMANGMNMNHQGMMPMMSGGQAMHNPQQHLQEMKTSLKLTTEQQPVWDAFEKAALTQMKSMQGMRESMQGMHGGPGSGENMADHMAQMEARFAGMKKVHAARQALFDVLTDEQKELMQHQFPGWHGQHQG